MILVSPRLADIVAGYERLVRAEAELRHAWRAPLLDGYASRRRKALEDEADYRLKLKQFKRRALAGFLLGALLLFLGAVAAMVELYLYSAGGLRGVLICVAPLLLLSGLGGWGLLGVLYIVWRENHPKPGLPEHPWRGGTNKSLLPAWREGLRGGLPPAAEYNGAAGEQAFVNRLLRLSSPASGLPDYLIYRLRQQHGDDVDAVLVGCKGVWVFEVKYLNGEIAFRDGRWEHLKTYYLPGGAPVSETKPLGEPFHQQWQRMAADVSETLRRRAPDLVARLPQVLKIRGGLAFTHPEAVYKIPPKSPFPWGVADFWVREYQQAAPLPGLDEHAICEILEALLERHRQVSGEKPNRSMLDYAERLISRREQQLSQANRR